MFTILTSIAVAVAFAHASALPYTQPNLRQRQATNSTIQWQRCTKSFSTSCSQAQVTVPLDYANPAIGTTQITIVRYAAKTLPRKGSIFVNPGGPGVSGLEWLAKGPTKIQNIIGKDWDILTFDPRGVGLSGPVLKQFASANEESAFWESVMRPGAFEAHGNLTLSNDVGFFLAQAAAMDERLKALDELFVKNNGDNLKYIGSAAVVRDLATIFDALEGPGSDINLYGYSYGTILGYWVTQMFPERSGKIILDGVVDPSDWSLYQPYLGWDLAIADAEATYKGFTEACAAIGPSGCSLAKSSTETAADIDARVEGVLSNLYRSWKYPSQYSYSDMVWEIFDYLYSPTTWDKLAQLLNRYSTTATFGREAVTVRRPLNIIRTNPIIRPLPFIETGEGVLPRSSNGPLSGGDFATDETNDYTIIAILCSDAPDPNGATTKDVFNEIIRISQTVSHKFGSAMSSNHYCHRWSSRAAERYQGPFNKKPKNVVLVIGNQADPITPFRNAKLIASQQYLGSNARLVQQSDFGHSSLAEFSNCTNSIIADYMRGTLPNVPDGQFVTCLTNQTILKNPPERHWDPVTSQDGDALSSGTNDPGLDNLGKDPYAADEAAFNSNSNRRSATPRSASIPWLLGFSLSGLAAAFVALL